MTEEGVRVLSYAVRVRVVLRLLANLFVGLAFLTLVPAAAAVALGEARLALPLLAAAAVWAAVGLPLRRLQAPTDVRVHEALVVTALAFLLAALVMWAPLVAMGLGPSDALFEAVSAVTTTGLTTLGSVEDRARTFLFTRAWMQWYGGLGIAVLSVGLVMGPGVAARRLGAASFGQDALGSARLLARRILIVYLALTAAGVLLLVVLGASPFDAVLYTLAGVSTGGFAPDDASLAALGGPPLRLAVSAITLAGAVSLPLYAEVRRRGPGVLVVDPELQGLLVFAGLAALVVTGLLSLTHGPVAEGVVMAISAQTTSGFSSTNVAALAPAVKLVLVLAMLGGGCVGSTAGGIKVLRVLITLRLFQNIVRRSRMPAHAVAPTRLGGERLQEDEVQRALVLVTLFGAVILLSWLPFLVVGYAPLDALFEVVSAVGTVGLSTGVAGPALEPGLRAVLCADMLLGRLEIVAVLVLLAPRTWLGRRSG